jgi:hypothetical protein
LGSVGSLGFLASLAVAAVLVAAATAKLRAPAATREGLATFGIRGSAAGAIAIAVPVLELALAAGLVAGLRSAAYGGACLFILFAAALARALARELRGAPCGCFGARSRVSPAALARALGLAAALALLPSLPDSSLGGEGWLGLGLAVALLAIAGLAVALLALAREVGELRLRVAPAGALEIEGEGPELGMRSSLIDGFDRGPEARLALAVFSSEGCPVCSSLEPAVDFLARDPFLSVRVFDEQRDANAWQALAVPGSPYAVALALDGTVLAKGTFNNLAQLESVLGTAERRERETSVG